MYTQLHTHKYIYIYIYVYTYGEIKEEKITI